jgi:transcription elongation factor GreA
MTNAQYVSMTHQAHTRLQNELAALRSWPSIEVPDDFMDTHENLKAYRARRTRIRQIEEALADAIVDKDGEGIAEPGMFLTVRYDDTGGIDSFILGGHGAGDDDNKIYPLRSPIGRAIAGACPGEQRTFSLPDGTTVAVTLLNAQPATTSVSTEHRPQLKSPSRNGRPRRSPRRQHAKAHAEVIAFTNAFRPTTPPRWKESRT